MLPRSLLVNWQRESEKFTPDLRMLEYHGQLREKDTGLFDQFDLILTTYGIVIKDIDLLRSYRFYYFILDESQVIKNPVSQSAKCCRLLQADHRLVMTGTRLRIPPSNCGRSLPSSTPVCWVTSTISRVRLAGPSNGMPTAMPPNFCVKWSILSSCAGQRNRWLLSCPPRTERIIYGDMNPAQRKIYNRMCEEYRKSLFRLIDGQGMDNARMKILEGLLRLRQICIHPRLVEKIIAVKAPSLNCSPNISKP